MVLSDEAEEFERLKFARWQWSHNLQQGGAAEAGDVKFAVEQRMGTAVMLLQEVRNWPGSQGVFLAMNFTQTLIWTLLLPYRRILHVTFVKKS